MVVNEQEIKEVIGKDVFTDKGSYCGKISDIELDISKFRIKTIVIDAAKGSYLATIVGGKKGVKIPYTMIQAIDDVVLVKHIRAPVDDDEE